MMVTLEELEYMARVNITEVNPEDVTEISEIKIDTSKPVIQKLASLASQTKNVYVHRHKDYVVKAVFQESGSNIDDRMKEYLQRQVEINV